MGYLSTMVKGSVFETCLVVLYRFFSRDARNLLGDRSQVVKVKFVKFIVNCIVVYGKSTWRVIALNNGCRLSNFIVHFKIERHY